VRSNADRLSYLLKRGGIRALILIPPEFVSIRQKALATVFSTRRNSCPCSLRVDVSHVDGFRRPVRLIALDYAECVDPKVPYAEAAGDRDSVLKCFTEASNTNFCLSHLNVSLRSCGWSLGRGAQASAVAQCGVTYNFRPFVICSPQADHIGAIDNFQVQHSSW
jgi:hypothetical protein